VEVRGLVLKQVELILLTGGHLMEGERCEGMGV
jgi:hypothetical protein